MDHATTDTCPTCRGAGWIRDDDWGATECPECRGGTDPCPNDPDGMHHVGCGCEDSDWDDDWPHYPEHERELSR